MSEYEIGKDIQCLRKRLERVESILEDMRQFCRNSDEIDSIGESTIREEVKDLEGNVQRRLRYRWKARRCRAMRHNRSELFIWANGSWKSTCELTNRSGHSKWGNYVHFYIGASPRDKLVQLEVPWTWQGNIGLGQTKIYPSQGSSAPLRKHFDDLWEDRLNVFRFWRCCKR
jgi:hypothetical protein